MPFQVSFKGTQSLTQYPVFYNPEALVPFTDHTLQADVDHPLKPLCSFSVPLQLTLTFPSHIPASVSTRLVLQRFKLKDVPSSAVDLFVILGMLPLKWFCLRSQPLALCICQVNPFREMWSHNNERALNHARFHFQTLVAYIYFQMSFLRSMRPS